jgi:hypothetical protein
MTIDSMRARKISWKKGYNLILSSLLEEPEASAVRGHGGTVSRAAMPRARDTDQVAAPAAGPN